MSPLVRSDPDLLSSIILEDAVHEDAMPSEQPFDPNPKLEPKKEEAERIPLGADLYPSASNGVSVSVQIAGVQRKALRLVGGAAVLLKSFLGSGGGTIRVVSRSGTPVPGSSSGGAVVDVRFEEGASVSGCRGGGSCEVRESEARALFGRALGGLPSLSRSTFVGAAVDGERDVRDVLSGIMADLASAEELNGDYGEDLDGAEEGKSDTVLITVCSCLDGDGAGYIEMRPVAAGDGRSEQQDHDVGHAGGRF